MKKYLSLVLGVLLCCSCGKFLEEFSQDLAFAQDCSDLDEILIGNGYMEYPPGLPVAKVYGAGYFPYIHVMDDDISAAVVANGNEPQNFVQAYKFFYDWSYLLNINPETEEEWEDSDWKKIYGHIGYLNVIIAHVKKFTKDPVVVRDRVEGEALFLRGTYYYLLMNLYANPYVKATAGSDMGVPLNLTEYIEDKYYSRNSMEECYRVIVEDLKVGAEKLKGVEQPTFYRVNEAAARVLLSRVYLSMGEWQLALDECEKVMKLSGITLMDMAEVDPEDESVFMLAEENPEILFTQGGMSAANSFGYDFLNTESPRIAFVGSDELISLYQRYADEGVKDLRLDLYFNLMGDDYLLAKTKKYVRVSDIFVIRAAELYLNKAEAEAMLDKGGAISTLKTLMGKRYKDGKIPSIDGLQGENLVKFIREERRRELCFEAHRWFDLRRYAVSPKYPEKKAIRHATYNTKGVYEGVYTLKPYGEDPAWVLPIPGYEIVYNQGKLVDNPERTKRVLNR